MNVLLVNCLFHESCGFGSDGEGIWRREEPWFSNRHQRLWVDRNVIISRPLRFVWDWGNSSILSSCTLFQDVFFAHDKVFFFALFQKVSDRQIRFTSNRLGIDVLEKIKTTLMEMGFYVQKKHTMVRISFSLVYYYFSCCKQFKWFLKLRTDLASVKSNPTRE